jgi:hypothetical protein
MTAIRPPFPDKMINPVCYEFFQLFDNFFSYLQIFPPMSHPTTNGMTSSNASMPPAQFNHQINPPVFPPMQQFQHNLSPTPPLPASNIYNTNANPTPPPTNHYNPSPHPSIRPMYPSPTSAYRAQVQQPQLLPQTTYPQMPNHIAQPPPSSTYPQMPNHIAQPPLPPPSSAYPYPYSNTAAAVNTVPSPTATYPGQLPPPPMAYAMGGSTAAATNQQRNNINGSFPVNKTIDELNFIELSFFRIIII